MAWMEVETDVGAKAGRVKYSVALKHGGARVSVPKAVVEKLGWTSSTRFKLLAGGGDTEGMLKLEPRAEGRIASKAPPSGEGFIIRLGRWQGLAPRDVEAVVVEHQVAGNALIITLPQHARNAPPAPRAAPQAAGPTAAKRDVTSQFFDDPKPRAVAMASGTRGSRQ